MSFEGPQNPERRKILKQAVAAAVVALSLKGDEPLEQSGTFENDKSRAAGADTRMESFENKKDDAFERAFAKREKIDVGESGVAEVVDVFPPAPSKKSAILLDPSTLVPMDVYEYVIRDFVQAGRRTLSINHPREGGSLDVSPSDAEFVKQFPEEQLRQALTLIKVIDEKNIEGVTLVGHSQRGASDIIAATLMMRRAERGEGIQRVRNLVLFESAGLVGEDSAWRLAKGFATEPSTRGAWGESFKAKPWSEEEKARVERENAERTERGEAPIILPDYSEIAETAEDKEKGDCGSRKTTVRIQCESFASI